NLTDISSKRLNRNDLFEGMDRDFVRLGQTICSNRAHMWAYDFKKKLGLDTGKIFIFYTKQKSSRSLRTWWYHVAPVVNEKGKIWVMDAGFPSFIDSPMQVFDWLES